MKVISIGTDRKIFEDGSIVRERQIEYGKLFEELHLIVFTPNNVKFQDQKLSPNVFIYPTKTRLRFFYFFDFLRIVKNIKKNKNKNDFVLSTQDPFETGLVGLILKLVYRLPLQIQVHTDFANRYFITHSSLNFIRFPLGLITLSFADSIRTVSERIAKSVHSLSHNISVLPVFTIKSESGNSKSEIGTEKEAIKFLTVCRLEKEKDLETAIIAFKKVLDTGMKAEFIVVGDGSQRNNLENLCRELKIENEIKFEGWQNNLNKYYGKADIYISTSLYEGYGMSMVEAASFGLPLVISEAGVAGDYFRDEENAFVCRPKDLESIAQGMIKLSSSLELRKIMGGKARIEVKRREINKEEYLLKYKESLQVAIDYDGLGLGIFKKNILLRYLVAGFTGAFTQIGLLYVFTDVVGLWYIYSTLLSFASAMVVSFVLQKTWTFGDGNIDSAKTQFAGYTVVALLGIVINTTFMYIFVDLFRIWYILAQIMVGAIIASFNFLMYKFFIFNKK